MTSTIQRVSTDPDGFPTESRPARVSSVVQSTPFSVPHGSLEPTIGRTSVTTLRGSFDLGIRQNDGTHETSLDQVPTSTVQTGKSPLHLPAEHKDRGWPTMGVLDEHPAEDHSHCSGEDPRVRVAQLQHDGRIPTLAHHLDGTPDPPPSPRDTRVATKPQRTGKVTELKKAFERGLSDFVRKRRGTESSEEGPGRRAVARNPRPGHPLDAIPITDSSPDDNLSKGSLFCSPLPTTFRREPRAPSSPLKDKISIFEGLVKPSSSSALTPGCDRGNNNKASFLTGDKILEDGSDEPTSRLPNKFRRAPAAAKGPVSPKQLRTGRREPDDHSSQQIDETDPRSFLKRLSSTFKQKHKPSRQYNPDARSSRSERGAEEAIHHSSRKSQSTPRGQKQSQNETRQKSAAESLRKRLEFELRSDASANDRRETQADQLAYKKERHDPVVGSQSQENNDQILIVNPRRKTTLWAIENPFDVPVAKDRSKSEATGGRLNKGVHRYSGHTESDDFSKVALARVSSTRDVPHQTSSASRYLQLTEPPQPRKEQSSDRTSSSSGQAKDGSGQTGSSEFVVVANAECELTHPRPSRSSDKKMINVLCKCGRETGEEQDNGARDALVSVSKGSSASFHTAPVSA